MSNRGYTLIELLVVVGIIAILAAMVMPVFLQAQDSARMRVCADNLRQLGFAIGRYMDDHDGFGLPQSRACFKNPWILSPEPICPRYTGQSVLVLKPNADGASRPWGVTGGRQTGILWICPSDIGFGVSMKEKPCWWLFGSSYMYPGPTVYLRSTDPDALKDPMAKENTVPCKPSLWKNPKRDLLLLDFYPDYHGGERAPRYADADVNSLNPPLYLTSMSTNVLFLDLHLKAVTPRQRKDYQEYTSETDNPYAN
jgi:prepilin-type N-terminal cleavage/methylation domain-containing protein